MFYVFLIHSLNTHNLIGFPEGEEKNFCVNINEPQHILFLYIQLWYHNLYSCICLFRPQNKRDFNINIMIKGGKFMGKVGIFLMVLKYSIKEMMLGS